MPDTRNHDKPKTIVIFRVEPEGNILAVFPEEAGTRDPYSCACYSQHGQHATMQLAYMNKTRPARPGPELDAMREELKDIGYNLDERKRITYAMNDKRRTALG